MRDYIRKRNNYYVKQLSNQLHSGWITMICENITHGCLSKRNINNLLLYSSCMSFVEIKRFRLDKRI